MAKITTTKIKNSSDKDSQTTSEVFQSRLDKFTSFIDQNSKAIALSFILFLGVCGLYFAWSFYSQGAALEKFDQAYKIEKQINGLTKIDPATGNPLSGKTPEENPEEVDRIQGKVMEFIESNPGHPAARNLAIKWSSYLFKEDKFDDSLKVLNRLELSDGVSLDGLSKLMIASSYFQTGKIKEAINSYKNIISVRNWKYLHPEARFQLSLALIEDGNEQEAIENLKTIQNEYPKQTQTVNEAMKIKRWLQYKKENKEQK